MKHGKLLALLCLPVVFQAAGQTGQKFVVNPGQRIADVLTPKDIYQFPEFKPGTVYFYDDRRIDAPLNYNLLTQTVQFVSPGNDTLSLADEKEIKAIGIDGHYYLFRDGYYEVKNAFGKNKFLVRQSIRLVNSQKIGTYGQTVEGGANVYTNFSNGATDVNLVANTKTTLIKEEACFFADENNSISGASKKNLLKLFSKNGKAVGDFIDANKIDFKKQADIEKLIAYLNTL